MIRFYTAFTNEIDDPDEAAREVVEQLAPGENMLNNTIGIVFFHCDFARNGVLADFAKRLPFPLVGCVSSPTGVDGGRFGNFGVAVSMLTADDVSFAAEAFDGIDAMSPDETNAELKRRYENLCRPAPPRYVLLFLSPHSHYAFDHIMHTVHSSPAPTLCCGMQVFNIYGEPDTNYTFANGALTASGCVLLGFYGDAAPCFALNNDYYRSLLSLETYIAEGAVTDGDEAVIREIDGIPALDYLVEKGIITGDHPSGMAEIATVPLVISFPHGGKAPCMLLGTVDGTKHIRAARGIAKDIKVSFSLMDARGVAGNIRTLFDEIIENDYNDIIFFCSASQAWAMGANNLAMLEEIDRLAKEYEETAKTPLRYMVAYSGGEYCPIKGTPNAFAPYKDADMSNMLHNFSLSLCVFGRGAAR
jgi:hypothetical protein